VFVIAEAALSVTVKLLVQFCQLRSHQDHHNNNDQHNPHHRGPILAEPDPLKPAPIRAFAVRHCVLRT
jgi:hypothetical protein